MKVATILGLMLVLSISTGASAVEDDVMKQLVPTGKLRVGVAYGRLQFRRNRHRIHAGGRRTPNARRF
jgi:hypothetical protein